MKTKQALAGIGITAALLFSGCAAAVDKSPLDAVETSPLDALSAVVEPDWTIDLIPVGASTVVADGVVLSYMSIDASSLTLAAFDGKTGQELWSKVASTGSVNAAAPLSITVVEGAKNQPLVAHLSAPTLVNDLYQHVLTLRDVHTGEVVTEASPMWIGRVSECRSADEVCFQGQGVDAVGNETVDYKLNAVTGETTIEEEIGGFAWSRELAADIFAVAADDGINTVVLFEDDEIVWQKSAQELFGLDGELRYSVAGAQYDEDSDVVTVTVNFVDPPDTYSYSADEFTTVAFERETGKVLWTKDNGFACTGDGRILCTGDIRLESDAERPSPHYVSTAVTVSRFDWKTGKADWEQDFQHFQGLPNGGTAEGVASPEGVLAFDDGDGYSVINLDDGDVRPLADDEALACGLGSSFLANRGSKPTEPIVTFESGIVYESCGTNASKNLYTEAFVLGAAGDEWEPEDEELDDDEPRLRVVQSANNELMAFTF